MKRIGHYEFSLDYITAKTEFSTKNIALTGEVGEAYPVTFTLRDVKAMADHFGYDIKKQNK